MGTKPITKNRSRCACCPTKGIAARGLCRRCYLAALARVRDGETTWQRLIDAGLALPRPPVTTGFDEKFQAVRAVRTK